MTFGKPFQPGNPGGGRPKGSRNKLAQYMIDAYLKVMTEPVSAKGESQNKTEAAYRILFRENPHAFLKLGVSMMPAQIELDTVARSLSDEDLALALERLLRPSPPMIEASVNESTTIN